MSLNDLTKNKMNLIYKGWYIYEFLRHWKQHFSATQHGVSINTNTLEGIKQMIDYKVYEEQERRRLAAREN